jgi:hypothetical protein
MYANDLNRLNQPGRTLVDMSTSGTDLAKLADRASAAAIELARVVLEQDVADKTWAAQLGPALSQPDTARLLGKSEQAVSKDVRLLRIRNRDDRPVYPIFQFDGRAQVPGVAEVIAALRSSLQPLTIASWLTAPARPLQNRRPVDALRDGDLTAVLALAQQLAHSAA